VGAAGAAGDAPVTVDPIYVVDVLNGTGSDLFAFSSPAQTAYLRPHKAGVVVVFRNLSDSSAVIHGEGAIPHQDEEDPMTPAVVDSQGVRTPSANGTYTLSAILPSDGANLDGYYTIHDVYKPERNVVFNASKIPAPGLIDSSSGF